MNGTPLLPRLGLPVRVYLWAPIAALALTAACARADPDHASTNAVDVRIRNDSQVVLDNVVVGGKKYGDIKPGANTEYQRWERAYRYSSVSVVVGTKVLEITPFDYVGEAFTCSGKLTYVLSLNAGGLDIRVQPDSQLPGAWTYDGKNCPREQRSRHRHND